MIHSTRAISLVLVSAVSVLGGYHALKPHAAEYSEQDEWGDPTTRPASANNRYYGSSGYHSSYYHNYFGSSRYGSSSSTYGSGFHSSSSSSSSSSHSSTSHGGFGSTGHAASS